MGFSAVLIILVVTVLVGPWQTGAQVYISPLTIAPENVGEACPSEDQRQISRRNLTNTVRMELNRNATQLGSNSSLYTDCKTAFDEGQTMSGVYTVKPDHLASFDVYCDMDTDGGGWTVFQRRQDGTENFNRGWSDYEMGFGSLDGEFWLGLDKIHRLSNITTSGMGKTLRVDVRYATGPGVSGFAEYTTFRVLGPSTNYTLSVTGYSGDAGDGLAVHNGLQFTTVDRDNDEFPTGNCASFSGGAGWWFRNCFGNGSFLNGNYHTLFVWFRNPDNTGARLLTFSEMKLR